MSWTNSNLNRISNLTTSAALKKYTEMESVHIAGRAPDGVQITDTDIWDRADATPTQQIWLAPTAARIHAIVSSSATDDSTLTGAKTVRVYGLTSWTGPPVEEDVVLTGVTPKNTENAYVIINKLRTVSYGSAGPNVGTITATAAVDGTISAVILPTNGQSRMAILGVSSVHTLVVDSLYAGLLRGVPTGAVDIHLHWNLQPHITPNVFMDVATLAIAAAGGSNLVRNFVSPLAFTGPLILKMSGIGTLADMDVSAGLDGNLIRVDA